MFHAMCISEDAWSWVALICGNHLGHYLPFLPF